MKCSGATCTASGSVPADAMRITQTATLASTRGLALVRAKSVKGKCSIKTTGKGAKKKRAYTCTIRLSKGKWNIVTQALSKTGAVVAQSTKKQTVK